MQFYKIYHFTKYTSVSVWTDWMEHKDKEERDLEINVWSEGLKGLKNLFYYICQKKIAF